MDWASCGYAQLDREQHLPFPGLSRRCFRQRGLAGGAPNGGPDADADTLRVVGGGATLRAVFSLTAGTSAQKSCRIRRNESAKLKAAGKMGRSAVSS